jgi:hypothetical protein
MPLITLTITRCAVKATKASIFAAGFNIIADIECEYGHASPTWPSYSDPWYMWSKAFLGMSFATPPEPGTPPYTDYTTDPWNNARTGIGAYNTYIPAVGDRLIALVTANGWTKDNIYTWNGASWDETVATECMSLYDKTTDSFYYYDGSAWIPYAKIISGTGAPPDPSRYPENTLFIKYIP